MEAVLGGPKPKALLAALVQARQVVSTERLVDLVWDDAPPQSANALVHTYISQLRRALAAVGEGAALVTRPPGYLLRVERGDTDLGDFESHLEAARAAERGLDHTAAAVRFEQALALWRGPAFGGVDAVFARTHAAGLEEDRLAAEESLARNRLALGMNHEVVSRLERLIADYPLREEATALLMRALHAVGRQVDALAAYRDLRTRLDDELGIEPGEPVRALHQSILDRTISPARPAESAPPGPAAVIAEVVEAAVASVAEPEVEVVPQHLPPDIGDFTGRDAELARILALAGSASDDGRTVTPVVVIAGVGGAGKSALAVHAAHRMRDLFPAGQLFADLRSSHGDLDAHEVLGRFLGTLGVPAADLPDSTDGRLELYRRKVAGRRLVIVLDNARGEHQVRRLLPGNPRCLVVITSRSRMSGLEAAESIELDVFDRSGAVEMLRRVVGAARVDAEPEAAATIASLCGGIPLALRVAAAKLLAKPHWPLKSMAVRLSNERRRLDELAVGDLTVRSSLRLNYADLDARHRRAFHLLTLLDLPDFGSWLAAPLLDIDLDDAEDVVERLVDLRLVDVIGIDAIGRIRYHFHDLVQLFGAELAADEPPAELAGALTRALATWTALVELSTRELPRITVRAEPVRTAAVELDPRLVTELADDPSGWLKSEQASVIRAVERAQRLGVDGALTAAMAAALSSGFAVRNEFDGWQRTQEAVLAAVRAQGDRHAEAAVLAGLGQLHYAKDEYAVAERCFTEAHDHAVATGNRTTAASALIGRGTVRRDQARFADARADLRAGLEIAEGVGDLVLAATAVYGLGAINRDTGALSTAREQLERAVELYRGLADRRGEALALRGLGLCARAVGDYDTALELDERAGVLLRAAGDELGAVYASQSAAKTLIRRGEPAGVEAILAACLEYCTKQGDGFGVALMTRTLGELALARGDLVAARDHLVFSLERWTAMNLDLWRARTLRDLAAAEPGPAGRARWELALELFTGLGAREAAELADLSPERWRAQVADRSL
ncbi:BTAD domain-containing putative transcriptional regulator [Actinosynnema sp. NPDC020468]|uniref:AfsR/SARP family transcriptional regulator n=1 Tax=Actinosynnema sp. NPDC020468 TaxID=3154488 RepID=UPI0033DE943E